ncbi:FadR/GntR family transcriptional regulator [Herbiconiux sp. L3-i23]|uniref:FadR/GntR family transcriptional regulator n=1 Tax=Herbiconiux sp. L3-i23 TaxID=2905871 RepID=UPI00206408A9|nr:FadR/GntR family transcriptional regulator [Herbiconiux sp. L3-i23]BDI24033.1 GntR family transcriptional regulator [Herbiconiux sp. L3-i23]
MSSPAVPPDIQSGYSMRGRQGHVIEAIGRAIVGGVYRPGDLLPREAELTAEYAVSRTSVREAMKVLAAKGLVDIRPKIGTRVRSQELWNTFDSDLLSWTHSEGRGTELMQDLVELRQIVEPNAARLAAGRASMSDLGALERIAQAMAASATDHVAYAEWDVAFHLAVYSASHNALLARFGMLVADFMKLAFDMQQAAASESLDFADDAARHLAVFEAINRGDAEGASAAMLAVVLDGKSALIAALADPARGVTAE